MTGERYRTCPSCGDRYDDVALERCPKDGARTLLVRGGEDPRLGTKILGRFTVTELLGKGGYGAVYRAVQHPVDREVAIKMLHSQHAADQEQVKRFFTEAKAVSRLRSPNTIVLYDFGQAEDGSLYMAMELAQGESLSRILKTRGALAPERAAHIAAQVCESLTEAHEMGLVHRDLKPDNIMVEGRKDHPDVVKVLDFGIAKLMNSDDASLVTTSGVLQGTPAFMSPEQAQSLAVTPSSDLYSLGVILYYMLSGRQPFTRDTPIGTILAHVNEPAPDLRAEGFDVPEPLCALTMQLLQKRPEDRPASAVAVRQALFEFLGGTMATIFSTSPGTRSAARTEGPSKTPTPLGTGRFQSTRRRSRAWLFASVSALAIGGAAAAYAVWPNDVEAPAVEARPTAPTRAPAPAGPAPVIVTTRGREVRGLDEGERRERQDVAAWTEVAPWTVSLVVDTPAGVATLKLDGKIVGQTPYKDVVPWSSAASKIELTRAGYKPVVESVVLDKDVTLKLPMVRAGGGVVGPTKIPTGLMPPDAK